MNSDISLLASQKVMEIMKYIKSPKTVAQISKNTHIPMVTVYRLTAQLEKKQYLKSVSNKTKSGKSCKKYHRGIKYKIIITPDTVTIKNLL